MPVYSFILVIVSVIVFAVSAYVSRKNKYISPLLIVSFVFVAFTAYSFIYLLFKRVDITYKTALILSAVDIIFLLTDIGVRKLLKTKKKTDDHNEKPIIYSRISINIFVMAALVVVFAAATLWQFKTIYDQILAHGYTNIKTIKAFYQAMRNIYTSNFTGFKFNFFLTQLITIQRCFVYISVFIFAHNVAFYGLKGKDLLFLAPLPAYFVAMFLTSGRTEMLMFVFFIVFIVIFAFSTVEQKADFVDKTIKILSILTAVLMAVCLFYGFYVLTSANKVSGIFEYFYNYSAGSIYNLDSLLNGKVEYTNISFGSHTLYSIYSTLAKFGFNVPSLPNSYLPATESFGKNTNIYTAIGRWYIDYGYVGIVLLAAVWSGIYNFYFYKFVTKQKYGFKLFIYALFLYPMITFLVEDSFFTVFSVSIVYKLVYFVILYLLFVERYRKKELVEERTFVYTDSNINEDDFVVFIHNIPKLDEAPSFNTILNNQYELKNTNIFCLVNDQIDVDCENIKYIKTNSPKENLKNIKTIIKKENKKYALIVDGNVFTKRIRSNVDFADAISACKKNDLICLRYEVVGNGFISYSSPSYQYKKIKSSYINPDRDILLIRTEELLGLKEEFSNESIRDLIKDIPEGKIMSVSDRDRNYTHILKNNKKTIIYSLFLRNIEKRKN